ncbi:MAG: hypothetical protein HRT83_07040 [Hyphomicrobiaceae bacterium]|nr:hypothetical protein [Hyphomicrobiaceae bacterium]
MYPLFLCLLQGQEFKAFSNWIWPHHPLKHKSDTGHFSAAGGFVYSADELAIINTKINIAEHHSSGTFRYNWGQKKPKFTLDWSSNIIDLSSLKNDILSIEKLAYVLGLFKNGISSKQTNRLFKLFGSADFNLHVNTNYLHDGNRTFKDVNITLLREETSLRFVKSHFTLEPGLYLEIDGNFNYRPSANQDWELKGLLTANSDYTTSAINDFYQLLTQHLSLPKKWTISHPIGMVFSSHSYMRGSKRYNKLIANGKVGSRSLKLSLMTEGELHEWPEHYLSLDIDLDDILEKSALETQATMLREVLPGEGYSARKIKNLPLSVRFNLAGIPQIQLKLSAFLVGEGWRLKIQADRSAGLDDNTWSWVGNGDLEASDLKSLFESLFLSGLHPLPTYITADGGFIFTISQNKLIFKPIALQFAGSTVSGDLELSFLETSADRILLKGVLVVDQFEINTFAHSVLLQNSQTFMTLPESSGKQSSNLNFDVKKNQDIRSFWPDKEFDLEVPNYLDIDIKISADRIKIVPGVKLDNSIFKLRKKARLFVLEVLDGQILGGQIVGKATIENKSPLVSAKSSLTINGIKSSLLMPHQVLHKTDGLVSVQLVASGQASNPHAFFKTLDGVGTVRFNNFLVAGFRPITLSKIIDDIVLGEHSTKELVDYLNGASMRQLVKVMDQTVDLKISDGVLTLGEFTNREVTPYITNRTIIDIVSMSINSTWNFDVGSQSVQKATFDLEPLPSFQIRYAGALQELSKIKPEVNVDELRRELIVRHLKYKNRHIKH